jgi:hypothetical protein
LLVAVSYFAVSQIRRVGPPLPPAQNLSFGTFNESEDQNCYTIRTDLLAIPHDVEGAEGKKKRSSPLHNVSANKRKTIKILKHFSGGGTVIRGFSRGTLEPNHIEKQGISI